MATLPLVDRAKNHGANYPRYSRASPPANAHNLHSSVVSVATSRRNARCDSRSPWRRPTMSGGSRMRIAPRAVSSVGVAGGSTMVVADATAEGTESTPSRIAITAIEVGRRRRQGRVREPRHVLSDGRHRRPTGRPHRRWSAPPGRLDSPAVLLQASSIVDAEVGVAVSIDGPPVGATPAWSVVVGSSIDGSAGAGCDCACAALVGSRVRRLRIAAPGGVREGERQRPPTPALPRRSADQGRSRGAWRCCRERSPRRCARPWFAIAVPARITVPSTTGAITRRRRTRRPAHG